MYTSFYPMMGQDAAAIEPFMENMPEGMISALGMDQMASAAGYLQSTVFGLLGPALLLVFAIGTGARTLAGAEEDGTLELELTHPVSRTRVYLERLAGLWAGALALVVAVFAVVA
ncbi:MAG: ABC transporter permease subunit, partial [Egicoccus sp.]